MSELSNAVTVLIARMESHPEDFDVYNGELYNKAKFGETAGALYGLAGLDEGKRYAYWFLNDADKEALLEAWKKYHRTRMEKEVMEKIFDDGSAEREAEMQRIKQQVYQQQAQVMRQQALGAIQPGQIVPMSNTGVQPYHNAMNAAQNNTGLLGSAANAFSGIFK